MGKPQVAVLIAVIVGITMLLAIVLTVALTAAAYYDKLEEARRVEEAALRNLERLREESEASIQAQEALVKELMETLESRKEGQPHRVPDATITGLQEHLRQMEQTRKELENTNKALNRSKQKLDEELDALRKKSQPTQGEGQTDTQQDAPADADGPHR